MKEKIKIKNQFNKIFLGVALTTLLAMPVFVSAETNAGITPSSRFYFFDTAFEKINLFFTFGAEKKAHKALKYADERLAEAEEVANENNPEAVEEAMENYQANISLATEKSKELEDEEKTKKLLNTVSENTTKHQETLARVLEKVPEEAKEAILHAIEVSKKGYEEATKQINALKKEVTELKQELEEVKQQLEEKEQNFETSNTNNGQTTQNEQKEEIEQLKKEMGELKEEINKSETQETEEETTSEEPAETTEESNIASSTVRVADGSGGRRVRIETTDGIRFEDEKGEWVIDPNTGENQFFPEGTPVVFEKELELEDNIVTQFENELEKKRQIIRDEYEPRISLLNLKNIEIEALDSTNNAKEILRYYGNTNGTDYPDFVKSATQIDVVNYIFAYLDGVNPCGRGTKDVINPLRDYKNNLLNEKKRLFNKMSTELALLEKEGFEKEYLQKISDYEEKIIQIDELTSLANGAKEILRYYGNTNGTDYPDFVDTLFKREVVKYVYEKLDRVNPVGRSTADIMAFTGEKRSEITVLIAQLKYEMEAKLSGY